LKTVLSQIITSWRLEGRNRKIHTKLPAIRLIIYQIVLIAGIIAPVLLVITDAVGVLLGRQYNAITQSISDLGLGRTGWLQSAAFIIFGMTTISLASELHSEMGSSRESRIGLRMMVLLGCGFILLGLFRTDPLGTSHSIHEIIHHYSAWAEGGLFPVTCFFFADLFRSRPRWNILHRYSVFAGISGCVLVVVWVIFEKNWFGLSERLIIFNGLIWFEIIAVHLRNIYKFPQHIREHY
jgi:hypothetical membrane protein